MFLHKSETYSLMEQLTNIAMKRYFHVAFEIYTYTRQFAFSRFILTSKSLFLLRLIDEKSGFNEDRDLLNKLRYIAT